MENNIIEEARVLYFQKSSRPDAPPPNKVWHISDGGKSGIPLSESYLHSIVPTLNYVDDPVLILLAQMLSVYGSLSSWYTLASEWILR